MRPAMLGPGHKSEEAKAGMGKSQTGTWEQPSTQPDRSIAGNEARRLGRTFFKGFPRRQQPPQSKSSASENLRAQDGQALNVLVSP